MRTIAKGPVAGDGQGEEDAADESVGAPGGLLHGRDGGRSQRGLAPHTSQSAQDQAAARMMFAVVVA